MAVYGCGVTVQRWLTSWLRFPALLLCFLLRDLWREENHSPLIVICSFSAKQWKFTLLQFPP